MEFLSIPPCPPFLDLQKSQLARFPHRYINSCSQPCSTGADVARRKQSWQARGLITLSWRSMALLPGVSHSKYSWLPSVGALWPLPTTPRAVGEKNADPLHDGLQFMSSVYAEQSGSEFKWGGLNFSVVFCAFFLFIYFKFWFWLNVGNSKIAVLPKSSLQTTSSLSQISVFLFCVAVLGCLL